MFLVSFPFDKVQFSELTLTEILNNTKIQLGIEELIGLRSNLCRSAGRSTSSWEVPWEFGLVF